MRREQRRATAIHDAYDHRFETYANLGYLRFTPGQNQQRTTFYAWDIGLTRYYTERMGVNLEARGNYGIAYVGLHPETQGAFTRPKISQYDVMLGPTYRFYCSRSIPSPDGRRGDGRWVISRAIPMEKEASATTAPMAAPARVCCGPMAAPSRPTQPWSATTTSAPGSRFAWHRSTCSPASAQPSRPAADSPSAWSIGSESSKAVRSEKRAQSRYLDCALSIWCAEHAVRVEHDGLNCSLLAVVFPIAVSAHRQCARPIPPDRSGARWCLWNPPPR